MSDISERVRERFTIPVFNLPRLEARIAAIAKRAGKLDVPPPSLEIVEESFVPVPGRPEEKMRAFVVEVSGEAPRINGWIFSGVIDHDPAGNLVKGRVPQHYWTSEPCCDHCRENRQRKETYILRDAADAERHMQIGTSCLKDFLNSEDPIEAARLAQWIFALRDELGEFEDGASTGFTDSYFSSGRVLALAAATIREDGAYVRAEESESRLSTADVVRANFSPRCPPDVRVTVRPEDEATAQSTLEWLRSDEVAQRATTSSYLLNLRSLASRECVRFKDMGILVSAVKALHDHQARLLRDRLAARNSAHVGEKGQRLELDATLIDTRSFEGQWGIKRLHRFVDSEGRSLIWWASGVSRLSTGEQYRLVGTVAEHGEYKGVKQTQLQRVVAPDYKVFEAIAHRGTLVQCRKAIGKMANPNVSFDARGGSSKERVWDVLLHHRWDDAPPLGMLLLEAGAKPTVQNLAQLVRATEEGMPDGDKLLSAVIEAGVDLHQEAERGMTLLEMLQNSEHEGVRSIADSMAQVRMRA